MAKIKGSPRSLLALIGFALSLALLASISACTDNPNSALNHVLSVVKTGEPPLSPESRKEFNRFSDVYYRVSTTPDNQERLDYFSFAFKRVRAAYVHPVSDAELIDAAIKGVQEREPAGSAIGSQLLVETALHSMVASLDPHSSYMNPDEFRESFVQTKGEFGGLGIEVTMEDGLVKIVAPIEDTPAAKAGLLSGDLITSVDGEEIKGKTLSEAVRKMRGSPGSRIDLIIRRAGVDDFPVSLYRAVIKVRSVRWRTEGNIGYVRVTRFTEKVEDGIADAMHALHKELGSNLKGIVLDLRNNPGGLLDQSLILSDAFLNDGEIVSVRGRRASSDRTYVASEGDLAEGLPMVVLINGGSASASEIVASALKHHGRAMVMGAKSFGKGSVQTIMPLPVEGALRLTTALYYSPSGRTIQAHGVIPDIIIKEEQAVERKAEVDLPGAIPAVSAALNQPHPIVPEKVCPPAGERQDRILGCALALLGSTSTSHFLASYAQNSQM